MSKIQDWIKLALRKCGRNHGKRHSVNRERSREAAQRAATLEHDRVKIVGSAREYKNAVAAYDRGEGHPGRWTG